MKAIAARPVVLQRAHLVPTTWRRWRLGCSPTRRWTSEQGGEMGKGRCSDRSLEDSMHGAQGQGTMPLSATASKARLPVPTAPHSPGPSSLGRRLVGSSLLTMPRISPPRCTFSTSRRDDASPISCGLCHASRVLMLGSNHSRHGRGRSARTDALGSSQSQLS
jgi:hypothetical protein